MRLCVPFFCSASLCTFFSPLSESSGLFLVVVKRVSLSFSLNWRRFETVAFYTSHSLSLFFYVCVREWPLFDCLRRKMLKEGYGIHGGCVHVYCRRGERELRSSSCFSIYIYIYIYRKKIHIYTYICVFVITHTHSHTNTHSYAMLCKWVCFFFFLWLLFSLFCHHEAFHGIAV